MNNLVKKGTSFFKEFQNFAVKGNVMDMAIGVVIGTAFGKIVSSLVADIIMPLIGLFVGSIDLKDLAFTLKDKTDDAPGIVLTYGIFLQNVLDFIIVAFAIFICIKLIINLKHKVLKDEKAETEAAPEPENIVLLREIRDLCHVITPYVAAPSIAKCLRHKPPIFMARGVKACGLTADHRLQGLPKRSVHRVNPFLCDNLQKTRGNTCDDYLIVL